MMRIGGCRMGTMLKSFKARMDALEAARWSRLTPLERADELIERHTPPEQWSDEEIDAYCARFPEYGILSDAELDAIVNDPESDACRAACAKVAEERVRVRR